MLHRHYGQHIKPQWYYLMKCKSSFQMYKLEGRSSDIRNNSDQISASTQSSKMKLLMSLIYLQSV